MTLRTELLRSVVKERRSLCVDEFWKSFRSCAVMSFRVGEMKVKVESAGAGGVRSGRSVGGGGGLLRDFGIVVGGDG